jgi:large subunit ribosomal protein L16
MRRFLAGASGLVEWQLARGRHARRPQKQNNPEQQKNLLHTKNSLAMFRPPFPGNGPGRSVRKLLRRFLSGGRFTATRPSRAAVATLERKKNFMPLQPARVKFRKMHRGNRAGLASRGNTVAFGEYGLMALERCWLDTKQIEAARVAINRNMKRRGKVWIRIFPQKSYTKKPLETRMGKGKGPLESWVAVIRPANVLFEVDGVPEALARESLRLAATKLMIRTKMISRHTHG